MKPLEPDKDLWWLFRESAAELGHRSAGIEPRYGTSHMQQDALMAALAPGTVSPAVPHDKRKSEAVARWYRVSTLLAELEQRHREVIRAAYEARNLFARADGMALWNAFGIGALLVVRAREAEADGAVTRARARKTRAQEVQRVTTNATTDEAVRVADAALRKAEGERDAAAVKPLVEAHRAWRERREAREALEKAERAERREVARLKAEGEREIAREMKRTARADKDGLLAALGDVITRARRMMRRAG